MAVAASGQVSINANGIVKVPSDEETLLLFDPEPESFAAEAEAYIQSHPLTQSLYDNPKFLPSRPHLKIPPALRPLNLTGGTLLGERKVEVPPLAFTTRDGSEYVTIQYLGSALCGHPGIIHGGLLATLLDEGLARCCFPALPNKVGVTASLKIDYRVPCRAEQYVVLRAETQKVEGRKAWVKGWIETLPAPEEWEVEGLNGEKKGKDPVRLVEAEALFVEPKGAATMLRAYSSQSDSAANSKPPSPGKEA
ncbi:hypothetical protein NA57DRAFT_79930 [Rhizodiscina lignyota]|uniref:Thioesterase domain-containing protein n=1 Tax=Rhizodiscina lignyota TaxID=1504668 RepID=A0A9P4I7V5_9PEZI|nr:hypothetical protein NA57DRAFT_79930 [Rhizodiscina lignyota]